MPGIKDKKDAENHTGGDSEYMLEESYLSDEYGDFIKHTILFLSCFSCMHNNS